MYHIIHHSVRKPGIKDEPQHVYQGKITCEMLDVMDVPYSIIDEMTTETQLKEIISNAVDIMNQERQYAIIVKNKKIVNTNLNKISYAKIQT